MQGVRFLSPDVLRVLERPYRSIGRLYHCFCRLSTEEIRQFVLKDFDGQLTFLMDLVRARQKQRSASLTPVLRSNGSNDSGAERRAILEANASRLSPRCRMFAEILSDSVDDPKVYQYMELILATGYFAGRSQFFTSYLWLVDRDCMFRVDASRTRVLCATCKQFVRACRVGFACPGCLSCQCRRCRRRGVNIHHKSEPSGPATTSNRKAVDGVCGGKKGVLYVVAKLIDNSSPYCTVCMRTCTGRSKTRCRRCSVVHFCSPECHSLGDHLIRSGGGTSASTPCQAWKRCHLTAPQSWTEETDDDFQEDSVEEAAPADAELDVSSSSSSDNDDDDDDEEDPELEDPEGDEGDEGDGGDEAGVAPSSALVPYGTHGTANNTSAQERAMVERQTDAKGRAGGECESDVCSSCRALQALAHGDGDDGDDCSCCHDHDDPEHDCDHDSAGGKGSHDVSRCRACRRKQRLQAKLQAKKQQQQRQHTGAPVIKQMEYQRAPLVLEDRTLLFDLQERLKQRFMCQVCNLKPFTIVSKSQPYRLCCSQRCAKLSAGKPQTDSKTPTDTITRLGTDATAETRCPRWILIDGLPAAKPNKNCHLASSTSSTDSTAVVETTAVTATVANNRRARRAAKNASASTPRLASETAAVDATNVPPSLPTSSGIAPEAEKVAAKTLDLENRRRVGIHESFRALLRGDTTPPADLVLSAPAPRALEAPSVRPPSPRASATEPTVGGQKEMPSPSPPVEHAERRRLSMGNPATLAPAEITGSTQPTIAQPSQPSIEPSIGQAFATDGVDGRGLAQPTGARGRKRPRWVLDEPSGTFSAQFQPFLPNTPPAANPQTNDTPTQIISQSTSENASKSPQPFALPSAASNGPKTPGVESGEVKELTPDVRPAISSSSVLSLTSTPISISTSTAVAQGVAAVLATAVAPEKSAQHSSMGDLQPNPQRRPHPPSHLRSTTDTTSSSAAVALPTLRRKVMGFKYSPCFRCGEDEVPTSRCSGCRAVRYCSELCQRSDWQSHKDDCEIWQKFNLLSLY